MQQQGGPREGICLPPLGAGTRLKPNTIFLNATQTCMYDKFN